MDNIDEGQQSAKYSVDIHGNRVWVPNWPLLRFCQEYKLHNIYGLLDDEGFTTTAGLLEVSHTLLASAGFKQGQIAEIQRALKQFVHDHGRAS